MVTLIKAVVYFNFGKPAINISTHMAALQKQIADSNKNHLSYRGRMNPSK
jgi:hypothetical protein